MKTNFTIILCALLLSATAVLVGCNDKEKPEESSTGTVTQNETQSESETQKESESESETKKENPYMPFRSGDFDCMVNDDLTLNVVYTGDDDHVVVPSEIEGKTVTVIGSRFLSGGDSYDIKPVNSAVSVELPDTIVEIEDEAFCQYLDLETVNIPSAVKTIGASAFEGCPNLTDVNLPNGLEELGSYAFFNCSSLTSIDIPGTIKTLGYIIFENSGLEEITIGEGIEILTGSIFAGTKISEIIIPSTVTTIESGAFTNCMNLTEITIPENVTTIDEDVFDYCENLKKVTFLGKAPENYVWRFSHGYGSDYTIYFNSDDQGFTTPTWNGYPTQKVGEESEMKFYEGLGYKVCEDNTITILDYTGTKSDIVIPATIEGMDVTTIGMRAFCNTPASIVSVSMPDTITTIEERAFLNCSELIEVKLSANLEVINEKAFAYCRKLPAITFPETLVTLGVDAFRQAEALKELSIPSSVKTIGEGCFYYSAIETLTLNEGIEVIGDEAFLCTDITEVTIPASVTSMHFTSFDYSIRDNIIFVGDVPEDYKPEEE